LPVIAGPNWQQLGVGVAVPVVVEVTVSVGLPVAVEVAVLVGVGVSVGTKMGPHWPVASALHKAPVVLIQLIVTALPGRLGPQMVKGKLPRADWTGMLTEFGLML
jgi:hypothetical protein